MKRNLALIICLAFAVIPAFGQAKQVYSDFSKMRAIKDVSDVNQVLVVVSVQGQAAAFLQQRAGPQSLTFVKVQPVIGARFQPDRGKRVLNEQDSMLFYFDQAKVGETYKLFDYSWTEGYGRYTYWYWGRLGIMGPELTATITKPGVYYMGAFMVANNKLNPDYSQEELAVMKSLSVNLKGQPGWKKMVDDRIKELTK